MAEHTSEQAIIPQKWQDFAFVLEEHVADELARVALLTVKTRHCSLKKLLEFSRGLPTSEIMTNWHLLSFRRFRYGDVHKQPHTTHGARGLNLDHAALKGLVRWFSIHGIRFPDLDLKLCMPKVPERTKTRVLYTDEELRGLLDEAKRYHDPNNPTIIRMDLVLQVAIETGIRPGELQKLEWQDFDLKNELLSVGNRYAFKTKSTRGRYIPLRSELVQELIRYRMSLPMPFRLEQSPYLFWGNKMPRAYACLPKKRMMTIFEAAGLPYDGLHCLRHVACVRMLENGMPWADVAKILGHATPAITQEFYAKHSRGQMWMAEAKKRLPPL